MTLREEIAQCVHYQRDRPCSDGDFVRLSDVLAIFDSYTANYKPILTYGAVDDKPAAPPSEERPARETGWLIERLYNNSLYYYSARKAFGISGITLNGREYSRDSNDAIRFSREEDAMVALNYLCSSEGRVADHCWIDANTAEART